MKRNAPEIPHTWADKTIAKLRLRKDLSTGADK
jgi:hypothetical protein